MNYRLRCLLIAFICLSESAVSFILNSDQPNHTNLKNENLKCEYPQYSQILPTVVLVGVKKSGTYALLRYLNIHPSIKAALKLNGCNANEIHYFDKDVNYMKGKSWYLKQMPIIKVNCTSSSEQNYLTIEKTPGYFRSSKVPKRIHDYNSSTKIILIVRDPVKRLQSEVTHCLARQKMQNKELKCLKLNAYFERMFRLNLTHLLEKNKFIRNSIYYLDLKEWLVYFNLTSQFFVLDGERFIKEPWLELNKIEKFLNVSTFIQPHNFYYDKRKKFYCIRPEQNDSMRNMSYLIEGDSDASMTSYGCLGKNKGREKHVYLSDYVRANLKAYYQKWNNLFFDAIGKRFDW